MVSHKHPAAYNGCIPSPLKKKKKITSFGQPTSLIARGRACQTSFICVKLNVSNLQIEMPCQHHMPELVRLNKGLNKSKSLTQRPHLHMKSRAIIVINIVYRHRVIMEARQSAGKGVHEPRS